MGNWQVHWIDYYKVLGVEFGADTQEIKKKYYILARMYHPDIYKGLDKDEKIKELNEAYEVLSSDEREKYDQVYLERMNNQNTTSNTQQQKQKESPKHTEEEMKKCYTEEERLFAKREAFKKVVNEELEKAKIIIDAKNELIYTVYQEEIDKEEYFETLKSLIESANAYLMSLAYLQQEAYDNDLLEIRNCILEVIEYIENVLNEIPLSPKDVKIFVEKQIIEEELEEKKQIALNNANELIDTVRLFYKNCYQKQISQLDYLQYREAIVLNLHNTISNLKKILNVLEDKQSQEVKRSKFDKTIGENQKIALDNKDIEELIKNIGVCEQHLKILPTQYEDAAFLGKKLMEKDNLLNEEITKRLDRILSIIKKYPTNKKIKVLYHHAKNMIKQCRRDIDSFLGITNQEDGVSMSYSNLEKEAHKMSYEAVNLFNETIRISKNHQEIYQKRDEGYNGKIIDYLKDAVMNNLDEIEALKLLNQVTKLLAKNDMMREIIMNETSQNLDDLISEKLKELEKTEKDFDSIYNQINSIIDKFNQYNSVNNQGRDYLQKLNNLINELKNKNNASIFEQIVTLGARLIIPSFWLGALFHLCQSDLSKITDTLTMISVVFIAIESFCYPENTNEAQMQRLVEEYQARKNYYDLKDRQYVFTK